MRIALFASLWWLPALCAAQPCGDRSLAQAASTLSSASERPTAEEVLAAARAAGSDAPSVEAVLVPESAPERRRRALHQRSARFGAPIACGEARSDGHLLILIAPRAGRLEHVDGRLIPRLAEGWREPRLFGRDAEGTLWQTAVRIGEPSDVPEDLVLPLTVQLVAEGPDGPQPVAERVLGGPLPSSSVASSDEPIALRIDRLRARSQVGHVRRNRRLTEVADHHARAVCARRAAIHTTEEGDPERRLRRAGIRARHVGETVARAADVSRAYAAMLRSPSHRSALTDRRFTDVGIGQASDESGTCLVVLLAAWPRPVPWSSRQR